MKNFLKLLFLIHYGLFFSCSEDKIELQTTGIIKGKVVKENTFEPIENVRISSKPNSSIAFTKADGTFELTTIPTGDFSFEARKDGYIAKFEAVTISNEITTELVFELKVATDGNLAPNPAVLTVPADNAVNQNLNMVFTWVNSDSNSDPITSKLILRNDNTDEVQIFESILTNTFTVSNLKYSTKYFWQIISKDAVNPPVYSALSSFRTKAFPNPRFLFSRKTNNDNSVIYAADEEGNQLQLTPNDKNSFRPIKNVETSKIAFIQTNGTQNHIYTMNTDGSDVNKITSTVPIAGFNLDYVKFSWKNNGSQIIFPNFNKLYQINADGSGLIEIFQTPNGKFITECEVSPNGYSIILKVNDSFGYNVEIYSIFLNGIIQTQILSGFTGAVNGIDLSADGNKLVFSRDASGFQNANYRQMDSRIYIYNFSSNTINEIAVEKPPGFNDFDVRFSPNEAELIFVSTSNDGFSPKNIVKYKIGLITTRTVLFQNATMPDWK